MIEDKGTTEDHMASTVSKTSRSAITQAINETLREYLQAGLVKCAADVGLGLCEKFANDVLERLGRPVDVSVIEYANFTGPPGADEGDQFFYDDALLESGVKLPPGVTADSLNATELGRYGAHMFLRGELPAGPIYFDAQAPQGVDSPFSLPIMQRDLSTGSGKTYALKLVKHTIQSLGRPIIEVPAGWTRETDVEEFKKYTDAGGFSVEDQYGWAIGRILSERHDLIHLLKGLLNDYLQPPEKTRHVWGAAKDCLSPNAKADLLKSALQDRLPDGTLFARVEGCISCVRTAFDVCDDVYSRWVLEGRNVWLIELAAAISSFGRARWRLTCLISSLIKTHPCQFPECEHRDRFYTPT